MVSFQPDLVCRDAVRVRTKRLLAFENDARAR